MFYNFLDSLTNTFDGCELIHQFISQLKIYLGEKFVYSLFEGSTGVWAHDVNEIFYVVLFSSCVPPEQEMNIKISSYEGYQFHATAI